MYLLYCSFIQVIQNTFTIEIKNGTHIGHERLKKNAKSTSWIKVEMHIKKKQPYGSHFMAAGFYPIYSKQSGDVDIVISTHAHYTN